MEKTDATRLGGIDFARVTAGFMVVAIHNLWWGGVLRHYDQMDWDWAAAWFFEALVIVAVNLFGLISGYLLIHHDMKFKKVLQLWGQALAMGLVTLVVIGSLQPQILTSQTIVQTLFPISARTYWYFSAYLFVYLMLPIINAGIKQLPQRVFGQITLALLGIAITVGWQGNFFLRGGFTGAWLLILYFVGAYWRLYGLPKRLNALNKWQALLVYGGASAFGWLCTIIPPLFGKSDIATVDKTFLSYLSPNVVIATLALFHFFVQMPSLRDARQKFVARVGALTFAVFLLDRSPAFWEGVLHSRMQHVTTYLNDVVGLPTVVGAVLLSLAMFVILASVAGMILAIPEVVQQRRRRLQRRRRHLPQRAYY
ncbi:MAG TPA: acyltransferase family protein [Lactobacillaceae bacterium]|jgi:surface polysaccharide O-acyltransferase-like enzyme